MFYEGNLLHILILQSTVCLEYLPVFLDVDEALTSLFGLLGGFPWYPSPLLRLSLTPPVPSGTYLFSEPIGHHLPAASVPLFPPRSLNLHLDFAYLWFECHRAFPCDNYNESNPNPNPNLINTVQRWKTFPFHFFGFLGRPANSTHRRTGGTQI